MNTSIILAIIVSFLITVIIGPIYIPFLRKLKFGQSIREEGPQSHMKKTGTPTMGGLMIITSVVISFLFVSFIFTNQTVNYEFWLLLFVILGYGLIGFLDDFIIVVRKNNQGLTSKQKLLGQIIIAVVFYITLKVNNYPTTIAIPGTNIEWEIGFFYAILIVFMLVGSSNAVNLTDGLDGLLAGTASIAFGAFAFITALHGEEQQFITIFALTIVGALLGFLVFNKHPAKVFMGDTGSLALGGAIAGIAILAKLEILLVLIGGVFVIETLSVILQVISFKTTGKRLFKMSPIHHHFELNGWSEWRVVTSFWFLGLVFAVIAIVIEVVV